MELKEGVAKSVMDSLMKGSLSPKIKKKYYEYAFSVLIINPTSPLEVHVFAEKTIIEIEENESKTIHLELSNEIVDKLILDLSINRS